MKLSSSFALGMLLSSALSAVGCAGPVPASVRVAEPAPETPVVPLALPLPPPSAPALAIACGNVHSCALLAQGRVVCWGDNAHGELGPGIDPDAGVGEHRVPGAVGLIANGWRTCALLADGTHTCWGKGFKGKEIAFPPVEGARFLLGAYAALMLRPRARELILWPSPGKPTPELGESTYSLLRELPPAGAVETVAGSFQHLVASMEDGSLFCRAKRGEGGPCPGSVQGAWSRTDGVFAREIVLSDERVCVLRAAGDVQCAGLDDSPPPLHGRPPVFQSIPLPLRATALVGNAQDTCALLADGQVSCWPIDGGPGPRGFLPAELVADLGTVRALAAGGAHTCALDARGTVFCFGSNEEGQVSPSAKRTRYGRIRRVPLLP